MPKNILIATDGSEFALKAARYGLELARTVSARASVVTVVPTWEAIGLSEIAHHHFADEYAARAKAYADQCLARVTALAAAAGVECEPVQVMSDRVWQAIIDAALLGGCDLIVMGSHGRRGIDSVVLGSETVKVLTYSRVPVLVYRE